MEKPYARHLPSRTYPCYKTGKVPTRKPFPCIREGELICEKFIRFIVKNKDTKLEGNSPLRKANVSLRNNLRRPKCPGNRRGNT